ncbi:unnamed protein product [Dicrocoelium dendriticum]|nr:unnamed protein product [Dicrocoelium dendriticum]
MDDSNLQTSFFTKHIYGDETRPSSSSGTTMYRTIIDPIVHYRDENTRSSSPRPESVRSFGSDYRKSTSTRPAPLSTAKIGVNKVSLSPLLSTSPKPICHLEDTYSTASHFTRTIKTTSRLKPATTSCTDGIQFYSLQEGLDWDAKGSKADLREYLDLRMPKCAYPGTVRENARYFLRDRMHNSLTSLNRITRGGKIKSDEPDHYRSVLYVVSRDSPKLTHRHRGVRSSGISSTRTLVDDNFGLDDILGSDHHYSPSNRSVRVRKQLPSFQSNLSCTELRQSKDRSKYKANVPHIVFQGPGRYIEARPRIQFVRSPKLVEARGSWSSLPQPVYSSHFTDRLHSLRSDSNRVIVDIKPRLVSEADKHQNTSQWIQVGTLGDAKVNVNHFDTTTSDDSDQRRIHSKIYDQRKDDHDDTQYEEIVVRKLIREEESLNVTSTHTRHKNSRAQMNDTASKPGGKADIETIDEELGTPDGTATNSIRSNITVNISPYGREQYFGQNSPTSVLNAHVEGATLDEGGGEAPASDPGLPDDELSATHSAPNVSDVFQSSSKREYVRPESPNSPDDNPETRNPLEVKIRPEVAPKPTPMEQLAAILEKPSVVTSMSKSKQVNNGNLSNDTTSLYVHGTFPRSTHNLQKEATQHSPLGTASLANEGFIDSSVPSVRNLAAFFTELIRKQQQPHSFRSSEKQCSDYKNESTKSDNQVVLPPSSPFFLHGETAEERERRLKAVENLRKRPTTLPPLDYSKYGVRRAHDPENRTLDNSNSYNRSPSAARPSTPLSTNGQR